MGGTISTWIPKGAVLEYCFYNLTIFAFLSLWQLQYTKSQSFSFCLGFSNQPFNPSLTSQVRFFQVNGWWQQGSATHVLDIIWKNIFFSVFLNLLYCLLNLRFLIVIQCFFFMHFRASCFLGAQFEFFFNYFVIVVISFCEFNTILMVLFPANSI